MVCSGFLFGTYILLVSAICVDEWPQATLCSTSLPLCACGYQLLNIENEITKQISSNTNSTSPRSCVHTEYKLNNIR
jgi:hypothetical protein